MVVPQAASAATQLGTQRSSKSRDKIIRGPPWKNLSYYHDNKKSLSSHSGQAVSAPLQGLSSLVWHRKEINFRHGEMEHRKSHTHLSASFGA